MGGVSPSSNLACGVDKKIAGCSQAFSLVRTSVLLASRLGKDIDLTSLCQVQVVGRRDHITFWPFCPQA